MRILFVGPCWYGSNARSMAAGLQAAGHEVRIVDVTPVARPHMLGPIWFARRYPALTARQPGSSLLQRADRVAHEWRPDVLFCFGTARLQQAELLNIQASMRIHYSPDDVSNPENVTPDYLTHEAAWDLVVTTKRHNVPEIVQRSGAHVLMVWSAFDPAWHHPVALPAGEPEYFVGFVGNARPDRLGLVERLGKRFGPAFLVAGERWSRHLPRSGQRATVRGPRYGEAFSETVRSIHANLVLLNSDNRDSHTCRSFEVPASGGLVVGERTQEHQEMLDEGSEALFFESEEELLEVLARIRAEPGRFREVGRRGHDRIMAGGHTYTHRAAEIIAALTA